MNPEYFYEPTDLEDELFLSEVPIELIQSSIQSQFDEPLEYRKKDYIQSFITKYEFSKDNMLEDDFAVLELNRDKFLSFIEDIFYTYLCIGFTNIDSLSEEDQNDLVHLTYRFFIKNIKKNFVNIVLNYITNYKNDISKVFEKKKDVTYLNFKSEIDNEYDILVLGNLGNIIDYIFDKFKNELDIDEFFNLCQDDEPILELEYVKKAFDDMELTGNFVDKYIDMIDDEFKSEIQSKVRNKILKKYPKRVRKNEVVEDLDDDIDETSDDIIDTTEVDESSEDMSEKTTATNMDPTDLL